MAEKIRMRVRNVYDVVQMAGEAVQYAVPAGSRIADYTELVTIFESVGWDGVRERWGNRTALVRNLLQATDNSVLYSELKRRLVAFLALCAPKEWAVIVGTDGMPFSQLEEVLTRANSSHEFRRHPVLDPSFLCSPAQFEGWLKRVPSEAPSLNVLHARQLFVIRSGLENMSEIVKRYPTSEARAARVQRLCTILSADELSPLNCSDREEIQLFLAMERPRLEADTRSQLVQSLGTYLQRDLEVFFAKWAERLKTVRLRPPLMESLTEAEINGFIRLREPYAKLIQILVETDGDLLEAAQKLRWPRSKVTGMYRELRSYISSLRALPIQEPPFAVSPVRGFWRVESEGYLPIETAIRNIGNHECGRRIPRRRMLDE